MEIKVNCRMKLKAGVFFGPGLFNDNKKPFHHKIYEEVLDGRPTVTLLSGTAEEVKRKAEGDFEDPRTKEETTMVDKGSPLDTTTKVETVGRRRTKR